MFEDDHFDSDVFPADNRMIGSTEKHCYRCVHEIRSDVFILFLILEIKQFRRVNNYNLQDDFLSIRFIDCTAWQLKFTIWSTEYHVHRLYCVSHLCYFGKLVDNTK